MNKFDCRVGQEVYFGRFGQEQTRARVTKINRVKVKVEQLEPRRQGRRPVGTIWNVPPELLSLTNEGNDPIQDFLGLLPPVTSPKPRQAGDNIVFPTTFLSGDKVTFVSSRTGMRVTGWVKRVNRKTISVEPEGYVYGSTYYRVPRYMLTHV